MISRVCSRIYTVGYMVLDSGRDMIFIYYILSFLFSFPFSCPLLFFFLHCFSPNNFLVFIIFLCLLSSNLSSLSPIYLLLHTFFTLYIFLIFNPPAPVGKRTFSSFVSILLLFYLLYFCVSFQFSYLIYKLTHDEIIISHLFILALSCSNR